MVFDDLSPTKKMAVMFPEVTFKFASYHIPFVKSVKDGYPKYFNISFDLPTSNGLYVSVTDDPISKQSCSGSLYLPDYEEDWDINHTFKRLLEEVDFTSRLDLVKKAEEFNLDETELVDDVFFETVEDGDFAIYNGMLKRLMSYTATEFLTFLIKNDVEQDNLVEAYVYEPFRAHTNSVFLDRMETDATDTLSKWAALVAKAGLLHMNVPVTYRSKKNDKRSINILMIAGQLKIVKPDLFDSFLKETVMENL